MRTVMDIRTPGTCCCLIGTTTAFQTGLKRRNRENMPVTIIMNRRQFIRAAGVAIGACAAFRMSAATPGPKESPGSHALDSAWPDLSNELYPEPCQISGVAI